MAEKTVRDALTEALAEKGIKPGSLSLLPRDSMPTDEDLKAWALAAGGGAEHALLTLWVAVLRDVRGAADLTRWRSLSVLQEKQRDRCLRASHALMREVVRLGPVLLTPPVDVEREAAKLREKRVALSEEYSAFVLLLKTAEKAAECAECGKIFERVREGQRFCSRRCAARNGQRRRDRQKRLERGSGVG